ncbi:hypothetical protein TSUD_187840 [Trifolium subterraneum]|uniref:Retrotransposon gag domain-containing protein n=1 Tax=Trifolium subterraneum TaxID=3900 RepID=A0A2Z6NJL7_TRISU|nr:hypothetical protein TSUD_187840 [Trifolium subterraneum]
MIWMICGEFRVKPENRAPSSGHARRASSWFAERGDSPLLTRKSEASDFHSLILRRGILDVIRRSCALYSRSTTWIAESLATLTNILARGDNPARDGEKRLERFLKHKPSFFTGGFNPDGAVKWVEEVEIIFDAIECADENKLTLGTYEMFKRDFFTKYFPADVMNKKVVEFMKLEQGSMSVADYAEKFDSLCVFSPHYNTPEAENDKCVKFESGLRPNIKHIIGFAEIRNFTTLVAKARICDEGGKAKNDYYKAMRGKSQDQAKDSYLFQLW